MTLPLWTQTLAVACLALVLGTGAHAQSREDSGSVRLSVAGKLRLEAEVLNRLACEAVSRDGAARAEAFAALAETDAQIARFLAALKDGNLALGIRQPEAKRRVTDQLFAVSTAWRPVSAAASAIAAGDATVARLGEVLAASAEAEQAIQDLLAVLAGSYSSSETFSFQASLALNVLVREKVILAEIATLQCLIEADMPNISDAAALALDREVETFEASLQALITGQPGIGLMEPPNAAVKNKLLEIAVLWSAVSPNMVDGVSLAEEPELMRELDNAEILYLLATSAQPDLYRIPLEQYASEELRTWIRDPLVTQSIALQNVAHFARDQDAVDAMDQTWRAERASGEHRVIAEMMARPLSERLKDRQDQTAGIVTEVFVMDNKGLNVGQSAITSDLWQGDED